ncbi:MAG: DUF3575 domain-containing protein [Bacteroidetes bacterium]|nr:DUF3575 domain-containing protein [Bacteroidota bacterium]
MKPLILIIAIILGPAIGMAQDIPSIGWQGQLVLKNGKRIKNLSIYEYQDSILVFEKNGSLHDVPISDVIYFKRGMGTVPVESIPSITDSVNKLNVKHKIRTDLVVKFNPLGLLEPITTFQGGIEYLVAERVSFQHELGIYIPNGPFSSLSDGYGQGFSIRNELKYYLGKNQRGLDGGYVSGLFLFKHMLNDHNSIKRVYGLSLKGGRQWIFNNNLVLDVFAGAGLRKRSLENRYDYWDYWGILPSVHLGFKVGFGL